MTTKTAINPNDNVLISADSLARRWSDSGDEFSLATLSRWRTMPNGNGLPFVKLGKSVRYRLSDVIEFERKNLNGKRA